MRLIMILFEFLDLLLFRRLVSLFVIVGIDVESVVFDI